MAPTTTRHGTYRNPGPHLWEQKMACGFFLRGAGRNPQRHMPSPIARAISVIVACQAIVVSNLAAQSGGREIFVGSELETYLRLLQIDGRAGLYPWTIRGFSPAEVDRLLEDGPDHPWADRYDLGLQSVAKPFQGHPYLPLR